VHAVEPPPLTDVRGEVARGGRGEGGAGPLGDARVLVEPVELVGVRGPDRGEPQPGGAPFQRSS